eukprot:12385975-Alexandrium_andersonii.AAC.1
MEAPRSPRVRPRLPSEGPPARAVCPRLDYSAASLAPQIVPAALAADAAAPLLEDGRGRKREASCDLSPRA